MFDNVGCIGYVNNDGPVALRIKDSDFAEIGIQIEKTSPTWGY